MLSRQAIERAAAVLMRGEAVILPTDTVPGLFVKESEEGRGKLASIKGRPSSKPFAVMFGSKKQIAQRITKPNKLQQTAIERLLPGKVTLIVGKRKTGGMGVRLPMDTSLRKLIRRTGPLLATSANISGEELREPATLPARLLKKVALVEEDVEPSNGFSSFSSPALASTVIDLLGKVPVILRKGAESIWGIEKKLGNLPRLTSQLNFNLLFVCGGNTCRSPMAEALFSSLCRKTRLKIKSAGLSAVTDETAALNAIETMKEMGANLLEHRSRFVDKDILAWADLILVMTRYHLLRIRKDFPAFSNRAFLLSGFPRSWPYGKSIDDPIGGSLQVYRTTARQIQRYLTPICPKIRKVLSDSN